MQQVPALLPPTNAGRPVHRSTVARWAQCGVGGVRLRRFRIGGKGFATTAEEVQRFLTALTIASGEAVR